ncbi:hypothetical protein R83H12_00743 [Fibrobacteria bacterium R8-3-H12]
MKTLIAIACLCIFSLAALPELKVNTKDGVAITSTSASKFEKDSTAKNCQNHLTYTHKYVPATTITLSGAANPAHNFSLSSGKDEIRGRGNSTWAGDKKPYRIKFDTSRSVLGTPNQFKSWALLANWYDPTFALNAVGFKLGKLIGIPGTPNQFLVDFYLNNEYKGIYQITDIVHVNKGRLEIDEKEGWLVEFDYHCASDLDEVDFATDYPNSPTGSKLHTFIKSPEDLPNISGYDFVKNDVKNLTSTMFNKSGFPENGYRDLIDLESVAKYLMLEQFLDNFDFNNKSNNSGFPASNFFHKDKGGKIKGGPIWDLDLIGGVEYNTFPTHYTTYKTPIMPRHAFYKKFFDDPVFKAKFKKNWDKYKPVIQEMNKQGGFIDSIADAVQGSVEKNFALQLGSNKTCNDNNTNTCKRGAGGFPGMAPLVMGNLQAYKNEVAKLKTWWNNRITFFDTSLTSMKIDTTKDIVDVPSSSSIAKSSSSSRGSSSSVLSSSSRVSYSSSGVSSSSSGVSYSSGDWSSSSSDDISSSSNVTTLILLSQNIPQGAKIEVYNLKGKLVYSSYSENSQILKIPVQTKGVYIIRIKQGNSTSAYQNRIYLN